MSAWKKFQFFNRTLVREAGATKPASFFEGLEITAAASGGGQLILGDAKGQIHIVQRDIVVQSFHAYQEEVLHLYHAKDRNVLLSIGNDGEGTSRGIIRMWNPEEEEGESGDPTLHRSLQIFAKPDEAAAEIVCMDAWPDLTHVVLGLSNGDIFLIQGDLIRDRVLKQQQCIHKCAKAPISVRFRETRGGLVIFVVSSDEVFAIHIQRGGTRVEQLDGTDAPAICATLNEEKDLAVGKEDGIHFYGVEGRRGCSAMEGKKSLLSFRRGYVFVATEDEAARKHASDMTDSYRSMLNVYDIRNNLIVFSGLFGRISHILSEWGSIFVIAQEKRPDQTIMHRIYQLDEKDTQTKLDTLFRKNLFHVAISLAKGQHFDEAQIADIHRRHGDHLYSKMAYDGAVTEYIETIKHLEPSYVIRRFLDAQRIEGLRRYLEALHAKKVATADHTTLLINCYTKLKDSEKLDEFIRSHSEVHYDVETAIRVCRQARNFPQSLFLALRHDEHDWVVKILVEDMERYEEALEYIHSLPFIVAEHFMKSYGKVLCTNLPKETSSLMMELCTGYHMTPLSGSRSPLAQTFESAQAWKESIDADKDVDDEEEEETMSTLSGSVATASMSHPHSSGPVVEDSRSKLLGLGTSGSSAAPRTASASQVVSESDAGKIRRVSSADEFLHAFVDQPQWLMIFLEFVTTHCANPSTRSFNALFELYLQLDDSEHKRLEEKVLQEEMEKDDDDDVGGGRDGDSIRGSDKEVPHEEVQKPKSDLPKQETMFIQKAEVLLKNPDAKYDPRHTLMVAQSYGFKRGVLYLLRRMGLYHDILHLHMESGESENVLKVCKEYGQGDASMWVHALSYFASRSGDATDEISEVLAYVEEKKIIPPLLVLQILARDGRTSLGSVKEYVIRRLEEEQKLVEKDKAAIDDLEKETEKMREDIETLRTKASVFQLTKCSYCGHLLELPAVHFMCMHSFHAGCIGENEQGCPTCASQNRVIMDIKQKQEENAGDHDQFFKLLAQSTDGFSTVAMYFGRGIFRALPQDDGVIDDRTDRERLFGPT